MHCNLFVRRTPCRFTVRIAGRNQKRRSKQISASRTRRKKTNEHARETYYGRAAIISYGSSETGRRLIESSVLIGRVFILCSGLVGPAPGHSPADRRPVHVHRRPAVPVHQPTAQRGLDAPDQVSADQRLRGVRMPDIHHAAHQPIHSPTGGR